MSQRIFHENDEDKNLRNKMVEESRVIPPITESNSGGLLTLNLLGNQSMSASKPLEIGEHSSSSQNVTRELSSLNGTSEPLPKREFCCRFCNLRFSTSQALGGHQNGHKYERSLEKMEEQRKEDEINSILWFRSNNLPYHHSFSSPIRRQGNPYPYMHNANLHHPISPPMNNTWAIGSSSGGYGGLYMPNTPDISPRFVMQMPNPRLTTQQFEMTNFSSANQNFALPIQQRSNTLGLGLFPRANQTPSIGEGDERNFNTHNEIQTLPLLSRDLIGEGTIQPNSNVSSSSTQSTSEEINLDLTL